MFAIKLAALVIAVALALPQQWQELHFCDDDVHSNLGGLGPDFGDESLTIGNVATSVEGDVVDLRITSSSSYETFYPQRNGVPMKNFGAINIDAGITAQFRFELVEASTGYLAKVLPFHFTLFDIDVGKKDEAESISVARFSKYWVTSTTKVNITQTGDEIGTTTFQAMKGGEDAEDPTDPSDMTDEQLDCSVTFLFENKDSFVLDISVPPRGRSRTILFGGTSALTQVATPVTMLRLGGNAIPRLGATQSLATSKSPTAKGSKLSFLQRGTSQSQELDAGGFVGRKLSQQ
mmetsp:Transcript_67550/g.147149  ORF Transcript_67550/g.147149 Transcript_67550/m.147149 type:complete len:291 (-) Transcript_67550:45-917(-)